MPSLSTEIEKITAGYEIRPGYWGLSSDKKFLCSHSDTLLFCADEEELRLKLNKLYAVDSDFPMLTRVIPCNHNNRRWNSKLKKYEIINRAELFKILPETESVWVGSQLQYPSLKDCTKKYGFIRLYNDSSYFRTEYIPRAEKLDPSSNGFILCKEGFYQKDTGFYYNPKKVRTLLNQRKSSAKRRMKKKKEEEAKEKESRRIPSLLYKFRNYLQNRLTQSYPLLRFTNLKDCNFSSNVLQAELLNKLELANNKKINPWSEWPEFKEWLKAFKQDYLIFLKKDKPTLRYALKQYNEQQQFYTFWLTQVKQYHPEILDAEMDTQGKNQEQKGQTDVNNQC